MNCKDVIGVLADFLDQSLSPEVLAELERHVGDCAPCRAYLETYRKTVELTGRAEHVEMPAEMKARLRSLLLDELRRGQG
jgi:anti-sigma factor RsiW